MNRVVMKKTVVLLLSLILSSSRKDTTLEEDQAELELVGELWCRLSKEHLKRGMKRLTEECCGYVTELLPQVMGVILYNRWPTE